MHKVTSLSNPRKPVVAHKVQSLQTMKALQIVEVEVQAKAAVVEEAVL